MTLTSFTDLYAGVTRMREHGDAQGAIALVREHLTTFKLHRGVAHLVLAELLVAEGQPGEAVTALQQAVAAGCRYKASWLTENERLAPLAADARFAKVVRKADDLYAGDAAKARPDLLVRAPSDPPPTAGRPLLIALHGNNSNARETARFWSSVVGDGWVVAIPQSSEIGVSPEAFTWNDRGRAHAEIVAHLARVKELHRIDDARIVLGGFSMGALQAIALTLALGFAACGVLAVAPWLPPTAELEDLVTAGGVTRVPAYVVIGDRDPSVAGARRLAALLSARGGSATLDVRPGMGHAYPDDMPATLSRAVAALA